MQTHSKVLKTNARLQEEHTQPVWDDPHTYTHTHRNFTPLTRAKRLFSVTASVSYWWWCSNSSKASCNALPVTSQHTHTHTHTHTLRSCGVYRQQIMEIKHSEQINLYFVYFSDH